MKAARYGRPAWSIGSGYWGAQRYRPFGTSAGLVIVPQERAVRLPDSVALETGACPGISVPTAHRCVFADGPVAGKTLLVAGGMGNVGHAAVLLASGGGGGYHRVPCGR